MSTEAESAPRYAIDIEGLRRRDRSFEVLASLRFCPESQARANEVVARQVVKAEPGTGRPTFETEEQRYEEDPFAIIEECCAQKPGYITPRTPLLEAVFRVFLATRNAPMTLDEIRSQLTMFDYTSEREVSKEILRRVLAAAEPYYGIRPVGQESAGGAI
jgi:hypothetical protein